MHWASKLDTGDKEAKSHDSSVSVDRQTATNADEIDGKPEVVETQAQNIHLSPLSLPLSSAAESLLPITFRSTTTDSPLLSRLPAALLNNYRYTSAPTPSLSPTIGGYTPSPSPEVKFEAKATIGRVFGGLYFEPANDSDIATVPAPIVESGYVAAKAQESFVDVRHIWGPEYRVQTPTFSESSNVSYYSLSITPPVATTTYASASRIAAVPPISSSNTSSYSSLSASPSGMTNTSGIRYTSTRGPRFFPQASYPPSQYLPSSDFPSIMHPQAPAPAQAPATATAFDALVYSSNWMCQHFGLLGHLPTVPVPGAAAEV